MIMLGTTRLAVFLKSSLMTDEMSIVVLLFNERASYSWSNLIETIRENGKFL